MHGTYLSFLSEVTPIFVVEGITSPALASFAGPFHPLAPGLPSEISMGKLLFGQWFWFLPSAIGGVGSYSGLDFLVSAWLQDGVKLFDRSLALFAEQVRHGYS
jgi:hypothetical protein